MHVLCITYTVPGEKVPWSISITISWSCSATIPQRHCSGCGQPTESRGSWVAVPMAFCDPAHLAAGMYRWDDIVGHCTELLELLDQDCVGKKCTVSMLSHKTAKVSKDWTRWSLVCFRDIQETIDMFNRRLIAHHTCIYIYIYIYMAASRLLRIKENGTEGRQWLICKRGFQTATNLLTYQPTNIPTY